MDIAALGGTAAYAYLMGSVPSAYLIARLVEGVDIRTEGEGNVGARNVFHVVGKKWGIVAFLLDFAKGVAVAVPFRDSPLEQIAVAGAFLIIGHAYPVWLRFIGGKGLAAAGGFAAGLMPLATGIGAGVGLIALAATRRFMPSLIPAVVMVFVAAPFTGVDWETIAVALGVFLVVAVKRVLDEPRMKAVEAETGWDRARGGTTR
ncbi:glycerol-3-phosphate acyltransferase [bacterium]|nr:glycerol-3-phosphate acyltransferase [bacterium]